MKKLFENWKRYLNEGELADLKWASNPANPLHQDPTPGLQQTQDRAEQLDQVDHAASAAAGEDAAAGVRQTEAPQSWSLVADEWLEAYNHAYDAAIGAMFPHRGAAAEVGGQTVYAKK